jgi:hypothetical protein
LPRALYARVYRLDVGGVDDRVLHLFEPVETKRNRALSPSIWAVSRELSKPAISGVSPS